MQRRLELQSRLPSRGMRRAAVAFSISGIMLLSVMVFVRPATSERVLIDLGVLLDDGEDPAVTMNTIATHINNAGQVAGMGPSPLLYMESKGGFYWDSVKGMIDIETLGDDYGQTTVTDMNGDGKIVGYCSAGHKHSGVADQAFLWDSATETMTGLGTLGTGHGAWSEAYGINDDGYVVGSTLVDSPDRWHAFVWNPTTGTMDDLGAHCPSSLVEEIDGAISGSESAIAIDKNNNIHVCYVDATSGLPYQLKYALGVAGSWTVETVDSFDSGTCWPSIAVDSSNMPHISYYNPSTTMLTHAWIDAGIWTTEWVEDDPYAGWFSSIAIDSQDYVHISYCRGNVLMYITNAHPWGWQNETVDNVWGIGSQGWYSSLALDSNDKAHISYYDMANEDLKYATNADYLNWSVETVDSAGDVGRGSSIAFDSHGILHFGYIDLTNHVLKHAKRWPGGTSSIETINCASSPVGRTSIAIDDSNPSIPYVFIGYSSGLSADYVTDAGGRWYREHLGPGRYSTDVSLALDSRNVVQVIYNEMSTGHLNHYQRSAASKSTAIAINSAGHVAGFFVGPDGQWHAFLWDGTLPMTDIVTLPGLAIYSHDVMAYINDNDMVLAVDATSDWHSYLYSEATGLSDLSGILATDMNDLGEIVGKTWTTTTEAVYWCDGALTVLPTVYGAPSQALDINSFGQIVGSDASHAIYWEPSPTGYACADIGALDQTDGWLGHSCAMAINDYGQVVGTSTTSTDVDHAFLWKEDAPPVAWFELNVDVVTADGMTVSFNASSSGDPDGSIVSYSWDFGDGTTATGVLVTHTYANPNGVYNATLTVTDDFGVTDSVTRQVGVYEAVGQEIADLISSIDATTSTSPETKAKLREKAMIAAQLIESRKSHGAQDVGSRKSHGDEGIANILQVFDTMVGTYTVVGKIDPGEGWDLTCEANLIIAMLTNQVMISGVPNYLWYHGCGPTAVGMIVGYWDSMVFNDLIEGDVSVQNDAANSVIASSGHIQDYAWYPDGREGQQDSPDNLIGDASEPGHTPTHSDDCIADFMHTSRSHDVCAWGQSLNSKVVDGFVEYVDYVSPSVTGTVTDKYVGTAGEVGGKTLTWSYFQGQVEAKHPMAFIVDINGDHKMDHLVAVIGYCKIGCARLYAFHSTWDDTIWWANFEFMQKNVYFGIYSGFGFDITDMSQVTP